MKRDLLVICAVGGVAVAVAGASALFAPMQTVKVDQDEILKQIVKASDEGTFDGKAAGMAFQNRDLAMACHFWQRSISGIDRMEQLMAKLPADSQAKLTGIKGLVQKKPEIVTAYSSVCPPDQTPSP